MATADDQDFCFPAATTGSPPRFIESPPLWRPSSFASTSRHEVPEKLKGKTIEDDEDKVKYSNWLSSQELKSSSTDDQVGASDDHDLEDEEEKMDMLWEDLNDHDQLLRNCGKAGQNPDAITSPGNEVKMRCARALKLSKANGQMKQPSFLVFVKVLKKFFLMHNSRRSIKKPPW